MLVGDLVVWFYEYLAGIAADPAQPGFKHIIMKPYLVGDLKSAKGTHRSPYGLIASEWRQDGGTFRWDIEIPANSTATVYIPKMAKRNLPRAAIRSAKRGRQSCCVAKEIASFSGWQRQISFCQRMKQSAKNWSAGLHLENMAGCFGARSVVGWCSGATGFC